MRFSFVTNVASDYSSGIRYGHRVVCCGLLRMPIPLRHHWTNLSRESILDVHHSKHDCNTNVRIRCSRFNSDADNDARRFLKSQWACRPCFSLRCRESLWPLDLFSRDVVTCYAELFGGHLESFSNMSLLEVPLWLKDRSRDPKLAVLQNLHHRAKRFSLTSGNSNHATTNVFRLSRFRHDSCCFWRKPFSITG